MSTYKELAAVMDAGLDDEGAAATHALINIAEDLARHLRVVSKGTLTLAVVANKATTQRDRAGMNWGDAHEYADQAALGTSRRAALQAQVAILRGQGAEGEYMAAHLDQVAPEAGRDTIVRAARESAPRQVKP
jgi:hypothetical protein